MIGKIIKYMRLKSGYKQNELAVLVGLKQNSFSDYEREASSPSFETILQIADICDFEITIIDKNSGEKITPDDLLNL